MSNFTKAAAQNNAENFLALEDSGLAAKYLANWKEHQEHSEQFQKRKQKRFSVP